MSSFDESKKLFVTAGVKYDLGLFELLEEDAITVDDNVLINIFMDLYYPNNSYEFSVVDSYIMGQIYELFLDETLEYNDKSGAFCVEKPEAVDSQEAVNIPKNVIDIIVERTLESLFLSKKFDERQAVVGQKEKVMESEFNYDAEDLTSTILENEKIVKI